MRNKLKAAFIALADVADLVSKLAPALREVAKVVSSFLDDEE